MSTMNRIARGMTGRLILSILATVLIIHLIMLYLYLQEGGKNKQYKERQIVIQKILNIVNSIETTPDPQRQKAVEALADPFIIVKLTTKPTANTRFDEVSYWTINQALHTQQLGNFSLSILLAPNQWLDIHATVYTRALFQQMLLLIIELLIFSSIFISAWSIYRFTKPLAKFKIAADRLGIDLNTTPLDIYGPKIVRETATALNQMQQRIQDLIRDRTQMLAAISHDLRTPITRLKLRAQLINNPIAAEQLMQDLDEMEEMINEILSFARQEATEEVLQKIDLISLLKTLCNDAKDLQYDITLETEHHRMAFEGNPLAIKRAFSNVINNAIRYADSAQITVETKYKGILITINDDGPGIPKNELSEVFAPFYRAENSRSRDTGGTGLGLAVTQDIIKAHHGSIELHNRKPHGLSVLIRLPKMSAATATNT